MGEASARIEVSWSGRAVVLHPGLTLEAFERAAPGEGCSFEYGPEGTLARVARADVRGRVCTLELRFRGGSGGVGAGALGRVGLFVHLDGDGKDWSDWTLEQEMRRKREHEALGAELFGVALRARTIEVNGKRVERLFPDEQWPLSAEFAWGEVVSGYDSKGGSSVMWVAWVAGG